MLNKFFNWLGNRIDHSQGMNEVVREKAIPVPYQDFSSENAITIRLHHATGGTVLEFIKYDNRTDRRTTSLHVIPEGSDTPTAIANSMCMESLRY